jgi:predicted SAM-dependent methyltransferase
MEHFTYPTDVHQLIGEVFRILQPGGVFSVVVPDAGRILQAYSERDLSFFAALGLRSYLATEPRTAMHHVNYSFRMDGLHRYAYDDETLGEVLKRHGFVDVRRRAFDPALDSSKRLKLNSLYMQGSKPMRSASAV